MSWLAIIQQLLASSNGISTGKKEPSKFTSVEMGQNKVYKTFPYTQQLLDTPT